MLKTFEIKQGEGKWFVFDVSENGRAVSLAAATLLMAIKTNMEDSSYLYSVETDSFDRTEAASGRVRANLPASETSTMDPGLYRGEFKATLVADTDVDKSETFLLRILPAVTA